MGFLEEGMTGTFLLSIKTGSWPGLEFTWMLKLNTQMFTHHNVEQPKPEIV